MGMINTSVWITGAINSLTPQDIQDEKEREKKRKRREAWERRLAEMIPTQEVK